MTLIGTFFSALLSRHLYVIRNDAGPNLKGDLLEKDFSNAWDSRSHFGSNIPGYKAGANVLEPPAYIGSRFVHVAATPRFSDESGFTGHTGHSLFPISSPNKDLCPASWAAPRSLAHNLQHHVCASPYPTKYRRGVSSLVSDTRFPMDFQLTRYLAQLPLCVRCSSWRVLVSVVYGPLAFRERVELGLVWGFGSPNM